MNDFDPALPARVVGDRDRLRQVLLNFLVRHAREKPGQIATLRTA